MNYHFCYVSLYKSHLKKEILFRRRSGLVVERRTPELEVRGLILTQVAVLSKIHLPPNSTCTGNTQEVVAHSRHD